MKPTIPLILALGLGGCASAAAPDGGVANYDALHSASQACAAKGGKLQLKDGGNSREIQDYACRGS